MTKWTWLHYGSVVWCWAAIWAGALRYHAPIPYPIVLGLALPIALLLERISDWERKERIWWDNVWRESHVDVPMVLQSGYTVMVPVRVSMLFVPEGVPQCWSELL